MPTPFINFMLLAAQLTVCSVLGDYAGFPGCGLLRLHSTYRHDLKIYASDEGRVQMTAAAFAKVPNSVVLAEKKLIEKVESFTRISVSGVSAGPPGSRRGADPDTGADGEECQHERTPGQWPRLSDWMPAEGQSPAAWNHAEGPGLYTWGLSEGM